MSLLFSLFLCSCYVFSTLNVILLFAWPLAPITFSFPIFPFLLLFSLLWNICCFPFLFHTHFQILNFTGSFHLLFSSLYHLSSVIWPFCQRSCFFLPHIPSSIPLLLLLLLCRVWEVTTGEVLNTLIHHNEAVLHLRFANGLMVTCSKDRSIAVWDMASPTDISLRRVLVGHRAAVNVVDFDDKYIVSASGDRTIKVPIATIHRTTILPTWNCSRQGLDYFERLCHNFT